ncbi:hypothetical protein ACFL3Y_02570 [Pseudomonadota bacterium]
MPPDASCFTGRRLCGSAALYVLLFAALVFALAAQAQAPSLSRYQRTVQYLQHASEAEQADFASDALSRLVEVYMAEADLARAEARAKPGATGASLRGWAVAVDQYANQLLLVLDDLEQGFPPELLANREGSASLNVAGRAVMLVHPRPGQQSTYEQEVLADFCRRHDCMTMTAAAEGEAPPRPIPMSAAQVSPRWAFTDAGQVCSHQGEVRFGGTRQLAAQRDLCAQLMQELLSLALELAWQRRHGVTVNWAALDIVATPGRPGHVVHLNLAGDSVLATLPLLANSEGLLADVVPWLRARSAGEGAATLQLDAAAYGWIPPGQ